MLNLLVIVHQQSSISFLKLVLSKQKNVKAICVPILNNIEKNKINQQAIYNTENALTESGISAHEVDIVIVESNYGTPGNKKINQTFLDYILGEFHEAKILAYSSTAHSLAKALEYNDRIKILPKGSANDLKAELQSIFTDNVNLSERLEEDVFTFSKLKQLIADTQLKQSEAVPLLNQYKAEANNSNNVTSSTSNAAQVGDGIISLNSPRDSQKHKKN